MIISDVSARRERLAEVPFDYEAQPTRSIDACNLCGGTTFVVLTHRDRYGYPARATGCTGCGLVFLNPLMTAEAYLRFYDGIYRPLVSAYHGRRIDETTIQDEQRDYAAERAELLAPFLAGGHFETMLDIGGSTGVVAHAWAQRFGLRAAVLDPAPLETARARALGLETIEGLVETVNLGSRRFDLVALCQTADHLLDVAGTLLSVRELLSDRGVLFVDIVDFRAAYLRVWSVEDAVKIDHPYYLTEPTMTAYLQRAGFEILRTDYASDHLHVGYVAKPGRPLPEAMPSPADVRDLWREIRFVQNAPRS